MQRARERGLFLRDAAAMGSQLGPRALRIAVKDAATTERMLNILADALQGQGVRIACASCRRMDSRLAAS